MKRVRLLISGKVQGVSFRSFVKRASLLLELTGFVRNLDNGRIECIFEGEDENIEKMIMICKKGPENAIVENIEVYNEEYKAEFRDFSVIH